MNASKVGANTDANWMSFLPGSMLGGMGAMLQRPKEVTKVQPDYIAPSWIP